jgi:hypothetical protein
MLDFLLNKSCGKEWVGWCFSWNRIILSFLNELNCRDLLPEFIILDLHNSFMNPPTICFDGEKTNASCRLIIIMTTWTIIYGRWQTTMAGSHLRLNVKAFDDLFFSRLHFHRFEWDLHGKRVIEELKWFYVARAPWLQRAFLPMSESKRALEFVFGRNGCSESLSSAKQERGRLYCTLKRL